MSTAGKFEYHRFELGVCGFSGAGKTTLCRRLIETLSPRYRVSYVKSDAHFFEMDREGKDTDAAWRAGAHGVSIFDKTHAAVLQNGAWDPAFQRTMFETSDFVLVEGRKRSPLPKLVFLGGRGDILPLVESGEIDQVLAFVGEAAEAPRGLGKTYFQRDQVTEIASFVETYFLEQAHRSPMRAVVLTGGLSTRMKTDKALLPLGGETQLSRTIGLIQPLVASVSVSARPGQRSLVQTDGMPIIEDRFLDFGPLGGIASALLSDREAAWLVVACDLPLLGRATIENLLRRREPLKMATAYRSNVEEMDGMPEPLCAIYEPHSAARLMRLLASGHSCPRKFLMNAPVCLLPQPESRALTNVNSPDEFARIQPEIRMEIR